MSSNPYEQFRSKLEGTRVLVIEDEPMVSLELQETLTELGCVLAGQAARLDAALALARDADCDLAIVDLNLNGERVEAVADILGERGVPFLVTTGYGQGSIGPRHANAPVLEKPYAAEALASALIRLQPRTAAGS